MPNETSSEKLLAEKLWRELTPEEQAILAEQERKQLEEQVRRNFVEGIADATKTEKEQISELDRCLETLTPVPSDLLNSPNKEVARKARQVSLEQFGRRQLHEAFLRCSD